MTRDEELYAKHADELLRFASTLVGPSMAEDVMAAGVVGAMTSAAWPSVRLPRAYLFRSVMNQARQLARTQRRRVLREGAVAISEAVGANHVRAEVLDALRRLSLRQRAVVFLTYWADQSSTEVADTLGVSRSTVERELRDARRQLKRMLS